MAGAIVHERAVRQFSSAPLSQRRAAWTRKGLALAIAVAINLGLIGGFLLMPPPPQPEPGIAARRPIVTVSIITATPDAAPAEAATVTDNSPAQAAARPVIFERESETAPARTTLRADDETAPPPETPVLSVDATDRGELGASVALIEPHASEAAPDAGARSTLRSLACAQRLGRERSSRGCGEAAPGFSWAAHIDPEATAQVEHQMETHLAGLGVLFGDRYAGDWPTGAYRAGPAVLAAPSGSLAASDGMRDRLPPMVPDPAFGD